jgi:hypothetical protein
MFKELNADCRRLPIRGERIEMIPDELAAIPEPETVVEEALKPKKQRKPRRVVVQEVVAPEPVDFYDYPFTERIEQQTVRVPLAVEHAEATVTEYTVPAAETSYEWLIDEEDDHYYDRLFRDHLQPRRA